MIGTTLLDTISEMVASETIDEQTFRRLVLTAMADLQRRMIVMELRTHRDWTPTITAIVVAVLAMATVWLKR